MYINEFEEQLTGGHPNSLGNTIAVVEKILRQPTLIALLVDCYQSTDEVVRLRASNALKRICRARIELLISYLDRIITEVAHVEQASAQWTVAQLFDMLLEHMSKSQKEMATEIMKRNIAHSSDWIVIKNTVETLSKWALQDHELRHWLKPQITKHLKDTRKSVARAALRAQQTLNA